MLIGPVFFREASTTPRRSRHYLVRSVYVLVLLTLICTAWFVVAGTQIISNVGDMAMFGSRVFQILAPLQLVLTVFLSAFGVASAVSQEKDRRTLILLLMTRMTNSELVLGKLFASLLGVFSLLLAAAPVFMLITLFGGVGQDQVLRCFLVTLATSLAAGSLGSLMALWREKTFQTLSMTALVLFLWTGVWEVVYAGQLLGEIGGISGQTIATAFSPYRAILAAAAPRIASQSIWSLSDGVNLYLLATIGLSVLLNGWAIFRVRAWNPSREVRPGQQAEGETVSIWGETDKVEDKPAAAAEAARSGHVDARKREVSRTSREVWDNPVLWREMCTWAYGRKVLLIRFSYLLLFGLTFAALYSLGESTITQEFTTIIPEAAKPLAPFFLVSLLIINALAVNSITNERDGQALDLLLVTDLSPSEFVFGKLLGILWVTKEMVLLPMVLCIFLGLRGSLDIENLIYLLGGLLVMDIFVSTLGIHCGLAYANSRSAIGISLGAVVFLFVGVVTCLMIMISFSGSFQVQYAPFLAFIGGGSLGLYVALGSRNPSPAIMWASLLLPIATFFAIVSFVLGDRELTIFLVIAAVYGFTTSSMLVPAVAEFDIAVGRTKTAADE